MRGFVYLFVFLHCGWKVSASLESCSLPLHSVEFLKTVINYTILYLRDPEYLPYVANQYSWKLDHFKGNLDCEDSFKFLQCGVTALTYHVTTFADTFQNVLPELKATLNKLDEVMAVKLDQMKEGLGDGRIADIELLEQSLKGLQLLVKIKEEGIQLATQVLVSEIRSGDGIMSTTERLEGNLDGSALRNILEVSLSNKTNVDISNVITFCKALRDCRMREYAYITLVKMISEKAPFRISPQMVLVAKAILPDTECPFPALHAKLNQTFNLELKTVSNLGAEYHKREEDKRRWKTIIATDFGGNIRNTKFLLTRIERLPQKSDQAYAFMALLEEILKVPEILGYHVLVLLQRAKLLFKEFSLPLDVEQDFKELFQRFPTPIQALLFHDFIRIKERNHGLYLGLALDETETTSNILACPENVTDFYSEWKVKVTSNGENYTLENPSLKEHLSASLYDEDTNLFDGEPTYWEIMTMINGTNFSFRHRDTNHWLNIELKSLYGKPQTLEEGKYAGCSKVVGQRHSGQLWGIESVEYSFNENSVM